VAEKALKLKSDRVVVKSPGLLHIHSSETKETAMLFALYRLADKLPAVPVCGIAGVHRAIVHKQGSGKQSKYCLMIEGDPFDQIMNCVGVDAPNTECNHVMKVEEVLGIEAARSTIISEIHFVMSQYGLHIDSRHLALLGDVMTYRGEVLGINRHGIGKMKDSVLSRASFECTSDHLFEAAVQSSSDTINGVTEAIIIGGSSRVGTGIFDLTHAMFPATRDATFQTSSLLLYGNYETPDGAEC
jgi:DNA-directed RNA polymerase III subunit RPC1